MRTVLNIGGATKAAAIPAHYNGWEHLLLDIDPRGDVDFVCDARLLREKFPAGAYDAVYCSHNLEHYYRHDVDRVLQGFLHVLNDEGFAEIRVPDIGSLIKLLAANDFDIEEEIYRGGVGPVTAHDMLYGYGPEIEASGQDFYAHKNGFTRDSLARALRSNGFGEIYACPPLAELEIRLIAFKTSAGASHRVALSLGEPVEPRPMSGLATKRRPVYQTSAPPTDPVEALYQRAVAEWGMGQWTPAADLARQALAAEPKLPALHYLLGCCQLEQEQHDAALEAFSRCLALAPPHPLAEQAGARLALCRARIDLRNGVRPASESLAKEHARAVSVTVCSADPARLARAEASYHRLLAEIPHEVIGIRDARSLAEGYNRGLDRSRHEIVIFAHDDVEIVSPDFAARLLRALRDQDLVGIAGTRKLVGGAWHFAGHPHVCGQIGTPAEREGEYVVTVYGVVERVSRGLRALDGVLLATRRDAAQRIGFDEATFDGWHLYDLDFSLRAAREGLACATCNDILAVRGPQGSYDERWLKYSERFLKKHGDHVERGGSIFHLPDLVVLTVRSSAEWRLMTQHLVG